MPVPTTPTHRHTCPLLYRAECLHRVPSAAVPVHASHALLHSGCTPAIAPQLIPTVPPVATYWLVIPEMMRAACSTDNTRVKHTTAQHTREGGKDLAGWPLLARLAGCSASFTRNVQRDAEAVHKSQQKRSTQVTERGCSSGGRLLRSLRLLRRQLGRLAGWAVRLQLAAPRQHLALGRLLVHAAAAVGCSAVTRQLLLPTEPVVCRQAGRQAQGASPGGPSGPAGRPPGRSPAGGTATPPAPARAAMVTQPLPPWKNASWTACCKSPTHKPHPTRTGPPHRRTACAGLSDS